MAGAKSGRVCARPWRRPRVCRSEGVDGEIKLARCELGSRERHQIGNLSIASPVDAIGLPRRQPKPMMPSWHDLVLPTVSDHQERHYVWSLVSAPRTSAGPQPLRRRFLPCARADSSVYAPAALQSPRERGSADAPFPPHSHPARLRWPRGDYARQRECRGLPLRFVACRFLG